MVAGQLLVTRPVAVLYQLRQPASHTVRCIRSRIQALEVAMAIGVTSHAPPPRRASSRTRPTTWSTWHSSMNRIELCPRLVLGP